MKSWPLVSVGVPTYNRATTLKRAIESVLAQDYGALELIISDNGSTDETQALCEEYCRSNQRVRYIRQPRNLGAKANFQAVLNGAQGEYFMWLADDDWLDPDYVRECLAVLAKQPDCQLVSGRARYYENDNFCYEEEAINLIERDGYDRVLAYFRQVNTNGVFYGLMRRNVVAGIELHNKLGGDWLVVANLSFLGKVRTLDIVHVNRSMGGVSHQSAEKVVSGHGLPAFTARSPFLIVALNVFRDVAWKSPIYKSLPTGKRISLGARSATRIIRQTKAINWLEKLIEWLESVSEFWGKKIVELQTKLILRTRLKRGIRKVRAKISQAK